MALSQPGSAVEWWVFILIQCDPQTPSHSHSHWASRQSEAYFGLMCCQAPSLRFLRPPRHRGDPPCLAPAPAPAPAPVCFPPPSRNPHHLPDQESPFPIFVGLFFFPFLSVRGVAGPAAACHLLTLTMQSGFPLAQRPEPRWAVTISPRETVTTSTLAATRGPPLPPPPPPSGAHRLRGLHCSATFIES